MLPAQVAPAPQRRQPVSYSLVVVIWFASNLVFGALSAYAASRWGRDPFAWLLGGALLGLFGFAVLLALRRDDIRRSRRGLAGSGARTGAKPEVRVLIPVDGSPSSARAVQHVIDHFAANLDEVGVVGVLPIESAAGITAAEDSLRRRRLEEDMEQHLGPACASLRAAGIACQPITRFGDPGDEILLLAQEGDYDLIVMGRRGRGRLAEFLLGSVSEKVTKAAPCAVTVVS
jgi:nucleotide-binding universal stress UspA family protein